MMEPSTDRGFRMYIKDKVSRLPLPIIPATLGLLVLSGTYDQLGFPLVHWIAAGVSTFVALAYCLKIVLHLRSVIAAEYANPMLAALYPTLPMLIMVLCVFYAPLAWDACRVIFFILLGVQFVHAAVFFVRFFVRRFEWKTFMPSWYVTTNGVMVTTVAGMQFMPIELAEFIVVWGTVLYVVLTPFMIWRMSRCEVAETTMHSQAIMLGPCSLCLVSYVNVFPEPSAIIVGVLYACVVVSLVYVVAKLPKFFSVAFHPGYAGMTFPMAVGLLASNAAASTFAAAGLPVLAWGAGQLAGIQLVLATTIVAVVYARFLGMFAAGLRRDRENGVLAPEQLAAVRAVQAYLRRGSADVAPSTASESFVPVAAGAAGEAEADGADAAGVEDGRGAADAAGKAREAEAAADPDEPAEKK